jgi:hypothetical protein
MAAEDNKAAVLRFYEEVINGTDLDVIDELLTLMESTIPSAARAPKRPSSSSACSTRPSRPARRGQRRDRRGDLVAARVTYSGTHEGESVGIPATASRPRPTGSTSSGCRTASRPSIGADRTWPACSSSLASCPHRARPPSSGRGGLTAGMPLTLPANGGQSAVQAVAVVPEESVAALVDLAGPLLGVDHEQPAWADDEVDAPYL